MSRIRSVHPGLWTDEQFVSLSPMARLLFIGIWNECDDKGSFIWSPIQLKMRLFAADNVDVASLLSELVAAGVVIQYEISGKSYGAVRNFCKFQRPKKPNDVYPQTPEIRAFCGDSGESKPAKNKEVRNQLPTGGENPSQMEDGGWRMEEGEENPPSPQKPDPVPYGEIQTRWNTIAAKHGLPLCQRMTEPRRKAIKARFGESGMDGITQAFNAVEQSDFCLGLKTDFRADFDFVFQAKSFTRLIEGSYAGRVNGSGGNRGSPETYSQADRDRIRQKYGMAQ